ncbi:MAG: hypothetical protein Q4G19_05505 [Clostridia bacterium]|nr:hypothetical protein [Clostridia bacterium]
MMFMKNRRNNHETNGSAQHGQVIDFVPGQRESGKPELAPWQYVQMEYDRVGLPAPLDIPEFETKEDAEIWLCLDMRYNRRLREMNSGWCAVV